MDAALDGSGADLITSDLPTADGASPSSYKEARGIIHLHSVYSHDACDHKGIVNGKINAACMSQLRTAICDQKFDFVAMTDHPSNMQDYSMQEDMLFDSQAGDQLVLLKGKPIANRITCKGGHQILVNVGFEAKHMMPLGLQAKPSNPDLYDGIDDTTQKAKLKQQVKGLKSLGSVVAMVHTEETDISASTILAGGFEAMEWYNIHANISALIGPDTLSADLTNIPQLAALVGKVIGLKDFLAPSAGAPHPDLVYLMMLDLIPEKGFEKWRTAQATRLVTGILGSDIHQNVSVDASRCAGAMRVVCSGALTLAEAFVGKIPASIRSLFLSGGTIDLSDGERIDSYRRLLAWLENRVLVKSMDIVSIMDALRDGRAYGIFTVFGEPQLFSFTGKQSGSVLQMGSKATGPVTLEVAIQKPVHLYSAPFSAADAAKAEIHAKLLRINGTGAPVTVDQVQATGATGAKLTKTVSQPGAYYVKVWIKPKHLSTALGTSKALANKTYLWVISNPIFL